jgi:hypothetical protein
MKDLFKKTVIAIFIALGLITTANAGKGGFEGICQKGWIGHSFYNYSLNSLSEQDGVEIAYMWNNSNQDWQVSQNGKNISNTYSNYSGENIDENARALIWVKSDGTCIKTNGYVLPVPPEVPVVSNNIKQLPVSEKTIRSGQTDVVIADFEVKGDVIVNEILFNFNNTNTGVLSDIKIWEKEGTNETLIHDSSPTGTSIFDTNFKQDDRIVITVSALNFDENNHESFSELNVNIEIKMEDNNANDLNSEKFEFNHKVQTGVNQIESKISNTISSSITLNGNDSDFLFEINFENVSDMKLKDLILKTTSFNVDAEIIDFNANQQIDTISIYANDKTTLLAVESIHSSEISFENINYDFNSNNKKLYIKVETQKSGYEQVGKNGSIIFNFQKAIFEKEYNGDTLEIKNTSTSSVINFLEQ